MRRSEARASGSPLYGIDATVWWGGDGDYVSRFRHTGSKGETLEVSDHRSDGYAAVAYVEFMICRGYKSIQGDNCSVWDLGVS